MQRRGRQQEREKRLERLRNNTRNCRKKRNEKNSTVSLVPIGMREYIEEDLCTHSLGEMNLVCPHCDALYFLEETNEKKQFTRCCSNGNTKFEFNFCVPSLLEELYTMRHEKSKNFRENVRMYNSALSFASFGAQKVHQLPGPYCFKIQGQIYHKTSNLYSSVTERRQFAQLFIVDTEQATRDRIQHPANRSSCDKNLMRELDVMLRRVNIYAEIYEMLGRLEKEEEERCRRLSIPCNDYNIYFVKDQNTDPRRFNLPHCNEVAAVFSNRDGEPPFERDIQIHTKDGEHVFLPLTSKHVDPMTYSLLYPYGEFGWDVTMKRKVANKEGKRHRLTHSDYYSYLLVERRGTFTAFLNAGKLTQQFVVDAYCKMEANRLEYCRQNQADLRADMYRGLYDYVNSSEGEDAPGAGRKIILPSSFNGSPRYMAEKYQDAMSIVTEYGSPDLFVTITANPRWKEIVDQLKAYETVTDRPDIVARVFNAKRNCLRNDIIRGRVLGNVKALVSVTEYQKRGLPHEHLLVFLSEESKFRTPEEIDRAVCAEIPDSEQEPELYKIVKSSMVHGPCGEGYNTNQVCVREGKCSKRYPRDFAEETIIVENGFPKYRRRNNERKMMVGIYEVDNRWIVPYNKYLTRRYSAHINVEICATVQSVKYLFLYIHKGLDGATIEVVKNDEISSYLNTRFVSPVEACYRLFGFSMHYNSHTVVRLAVHEEDKQSVCFMRGREREAIEKAAVKKTTLLAWFELNKKDVQAQKYLYREIPKYYRFIQNKTNPGVYQKRKRDSDNERVVGRMYNAHVREGERYFLRLMLLHQRGCTSFQDMRTVNGIVYDTYRLAACELGLLMDDKEWDRAMEEAVCCKVPRCLRELLVIICVMCEPNEPLKLWEKYKKDLLEDLLRRDTEEVAEMKALLEIEEMLSLHGKTLKDFSFPEFDRDRLESFAISTQEGIYNVVDEEHCLQEMVASFTEEQKRVFDEVLGSIYGDSENCKRSNLFFVNAAAGTGKTYIYKAMLHAVRTKGDIAIPCAWTGIAAALLIDGRTIHYTFKLPVPLYTNSTSSMKLNTKHAKRLKKAKLILIDEVTMVPYYALDAIDTLLKEITGEKEKPFGGKIIVFGGDFMQTLPIVKRGGRSDIVGETIINSRYWNLMKKFTLTKNMRVHGDAKDYAEWLLSIGKGTITGELPATFVEVPRRCVSKDLITDVFGEKMCATDYKNYINRAILAPKNLDTLKLNDEILQRLDAKEVVYYSSDCIVNDDAGRFSQISSEYLHQITPSGMPPHELRLKVGAPVILLRNLNASNGLCNGTRLRVICLKKNVVQAEIVNGSKAGQQVFLPRIIMEPVEQELIFNMRRVQFPIRLAYSMTINKSQGQTLEFVGLYLYTPVFAHGQLYVALSRGKRFEELKIMMRETSEQGKIFKNFDDDGQERLYTKNIVYTELLESMKE